MKRSRMNAVSAKRRAELREYTAWRKGYLARNPNCALRWSERCRGRAEEIHHVIKRSQGAPLIPKDEADVAGVCRPCHTKVDEEPAEAKRRGFVRAA